MILKYTTMPLRPRPVMPSTPNGGTFYLDDYPEVKGDGVTNDMPALQTVIDSLPSGAHLHFNEDKTYFFSTRPDNISSYILSEKPIHLHGHNAKIEFFYAAGSNQTWLRLISNTTDLLSWNEPVAKNQTTFNVADTKDLRIGEIVKIYLGHDPVDIGAEPHWSKRVRIIKVTPTSFTIDTPVPYDIYQPSNAIYNHHVYRLNSVVDGSTIDGFDIFNGAGISILVKEADGVEITNVKILGNGILVEHSSNVVIDNYIYRSLLGLSSNSYAIWGWKQDPLWIGTIKWICDVNISPRDMLIGMESQCYDVYADNIIVEIVDKAPQLFAASAQSHLLVKNLCVKNHGSNGFSAAYFVDDGSSIDIRNLEVDGGTVSAIGYTRFLNRIIFNGKDRGTPKISSMRISLVPGERQIIPLGDITLKRISALYHGNVAWQELGLKNTTTNATGTQYPYLDGNVARPYTMVEDQIFDFSSTSHLGTTWGGSAANIMESSNKALYYRVSYVSLDAYLDIEYEYWDN